MVALKSVLHFFRFHVLWLKLILKQRTSEEYLMGKKSLFGNQHYMKIIIYGHAVRSVVAFHTFSFAGIHFHLTRIIYLPETGRSLVGVQDTEYFMMPSCLASKLIIRVGQMWRLTTSKRWQFHMQVSLMSVAFWVSVALLNYTLKSRRLTRQEYVITIMKKTSVGSFMFH